MGLNIRSKSSGGGRKAAPLGVPKTKPKAKAATAEHEGGTSIGKSYKGKNDVTEDELLAAVPGALASSFVNARLHEKALSIAGLSEPGDWQGDEPEIPEDIAKEDHDSLSNLMGAFARALSTATWYATKARIEHSFYDEIVDYLESIAILDSKESNEQKRKASAATNEAVVAAKALRASAYADMHRFQSKVGAFKSKHATVSRVGGFVGDEGEANDQNVAPSLSTRGRSGGKDRGSNKASPRIRGRK